MAENPRLPRVDASLVYIGRVRTPFTERASCPRNILKAREFGGTARIEVDPAFREGLLALERATHVVVLYWMDEAERDLLVITKDPADGPRGVFSLRSPARPNPIALAVARLVAIDRAAGVLEVEQLDCRDGTPLLDIKPYYPSIDAVPVAAVAD